MNATRPIRNLPPLAGSALALAFFLGGCALHPVPAQQIENAQAAITAASVMVADDEGVAELKRAREKFALTKRWLDAKDNGPARWLAEQAEVDAELATAKVAAASSERAVRLARRERPTLVAITYK